MVRFDTRMTGIVLAVGLSAAWSSPARADFMVTRSTVGFSNPAGTVDFEDAMMLSPNDPLDTYTSHGVTFMRLFYDSNNSSFPSDPVPNINGNYAGNFTDSTTSPTFTISFATPQTSVAFALSALQSGDVTFTAFLGTVEGDSVTASADSTDMNFYKFTGTPFDAIQVKTGTFPGTTGEPVTRQVVIDNIQLGPAGTVNPVPAPSGLVLMSSALAGLLGFRIVRRKSPIAAAA